MASNRIDTFTYNDSQAAFNAAIKDERLTVNASDANYAGKYMYMHTDSAGKDCFKNINTRKYDV